ncbi:aldose epimerase family protein [Arenibacter sp. ARW7G5Y1]|uniref:aldose epimerase family protein n=1 Tax=Arenibacter sp. ARW7G5Y1 TaxID=2135619 RepID=UPI000D767C2C|nr:aldose epimerase family protein [Arenibacter sp. ARW7G5Y1]PXX21704.1 aldose 1-epimerase [Arenibacter sp. ARW7G5Y1]
MKNKEFTEISNENGYTAKFLNYGARWAEMLVPDKQGVMEDVLLGFRNGDDYEGAEEKYHGAVIGRYCGRIPNGSFEDENIKVKLPLNEAGKNHLHGGKNGFHQKYWNILPGYTSKNSVGYSLYSKEVEEGYPGDLEVRVIYTLTNENQIVFEVKAVPSKRTILNITNHAFFNLSGCVADLSFHQFSINGDRLSQDANFILTNNIIKSKGLQKVLLKSEVSSAFLLKKSKNVPDAILSHPASGRYLKLFTNQTSIQLYNGFFMTGTDYGKKGVKYHPNMGLAIEPQHLLPHKLKVVSANETYIHRTIYQFGVDGHM